MPSECHDCSRLQPATRQFRRVVPRLMLELLNRVIDDRTDRRPARQRRWPAPQRMPTHCDVRKIAARVRPHLVNHTQGPIQKYASLAGTHQVPQTGSIRIGNRVEPRGGRIRHPEMRGDSPQFRSIHTHHRMPAAVRTRRTIHLALYFARQDLKCLLASVMSRQIPSKCQVLPSLGGSQPANFSQVGDHALSVGLPRQKGKPRVCPSPNSCNQRVISASKPDEEVPYARECKLPGKGWY